ncbi:MAG: AMP-binding protein [Hyphomicrobiales bacterium]|nr:AMP-binding protein [Hyphomicrobiales bacterium]
MRAHAMARANRPAFRHKDLGLWRTWSWAEVYDETRAIAQGLLGLGLLPGQTIAVVGANRPRLYWSMTAAQMIGAVPAPVYADAVAEEVAFVLEHAEARVVVAQDQEQVDKILAIRDRLPTLSHILYDEPRGLSDYRELGLAPLATVAEKGRRALADPLVAAALEERIEAGKGSDPSVILYTSGTTGRSKGVVLSGERAIRAARDTVAFDGLTDRDVALAYLPLAWVGDHYLNYAQGYVAGFCLACPESAETAASDLREIGPTFHFAPPRVFEALLTRVHIRMADAGALKRWLFRRFMDVAKRWGEKIMNGERVPLSARLAYRLGDLVVYAPLKDALGLSRVRVAYTAGEAIGADLFAFYRSIGLNLKQLYGQTEAFLYVTVQSDRAVRPDAVGPPAPGVDLRIAESGEVQFKSPGMFVGYFREDGKTREAMTEDGYVKTGDAGFFEPDGQLKIIDRARDVGRLASGQLFAPKYIENKLKFFPEIREAVTIGDGRQFVAAMINIELASVGAWAERNNIAYASYQELAANQQVYGMIEKRVDAVNRALSEEPVMAGAQIRRFLVLPKELDADDGELTRTQKVRRRFIAERYAALVEGLYSGAAEASIAVDIVYEDGRIGKLAGTARILDLAPHPSAKKAKAA